MDSVYDIFVQGDSLEETLEFIIKQKVITIAHKVFRAPETSQIKVPEPQQDLKKAAVVALQKHNCELIGFERNIGFGRVDVLGKKGNKKIYIECGPCRLDKGYNYLRDENTELWIINIKEPINYELSEYNLYIVTRGPNWSKGINKLDNIQFERMRMVKNPLDIL